MKKIPIFLIAVIVGLVAIESILINSNKNRINKMTDELSIIEQNIEEIHQAVSKRKQIDIPIMTIDATKIEAMTSVERNQEIYTKEAQVIDLGEFTITAYCSCEICCGYWALNRPNGIVYGASGQELTNKISCACNMFDFGTVLNLVGWGEVIVQDRIAVWKSDEYDGRLIDLYFSDHQEALVFGIQTMEVCISG